MSRKKQTVDAELEKLQRDTFGYFLHEANPANGLVVDKTAVDSAFLLAGALSAGMYFDDLGRGMKLCGKEVESRLH